MSESPRVEVKIEGKTWNLWTDVEITLSMEELAPQFSFTAFDSREQDDEIFPFDEGDTCQVTLNLPGQFGVETVVTGYLERPEISDGPEDGDRTMRLSGGPNTLDLVQCGASPKRWNGATFKTIAEELCLPFGILVEVAPGIVFAEPVKRFEVDPGDTAGDALQRLCESYGVFPTTTPDGDVRIVRAEKVSSGISLQSPGNIVRGTSTGDHSDRFSHYIIFSQRTPTRQFAKELAAGMVVQVQDEHVRRFRPFFTVESRDGNKRPLEDRARHIRNMRAGRSRTYGCEVNGWTNPNGDVWRPNTLVSVQHRRVGVDDELLISRVVLTGSAQDPGYVTHLDLVPRETFDVLEPPKPPRIRRKKRPKKRFLDVRPVEFQ